MSAPSSPTAGAAVPVAEVEPAAPSSPPAAATPPQTPSVNQPSQLYYAIMDGKVCNGCNWT